MGGSMARLVLLLEAPYGVSTGDSFGFGVGDLDWRRVLGSCTLLEMVHCSVPARVKELVVCSKLSSMAACCLSAALSRVRLLGLAPLTPEYIGSQQFGNDLWFSKVTNGPLSSSCLVVATVAGACSIWDGFQASVAFIQASFDVARLCSSRTSYSGDVKGTPGIRGNSENLTFPRIRSMVENGYRYQGNSKNKLADCAGFSGWAKLGL
ncbi:hypothetical protein Bca101_062276 [Brassica carinata]